ncbi:MULTISPECIES: lipopolysaccharide assembly protein LapB [unclassified Crossiella]|uniref:tetratricopeptide repeat protein n=1 Tax=unclassified Crossiella TaxID=2620835 RepID=UPI001FFF798C|nr:MULTISPECIES: hypothetical protein [unclassified Crossiella]MCK2242969.1 hypothetical protein [Crossiella sp. S99.2]MCK2256846.1 hypothetical protein [Crossiella sp. S99.1]
MTAALTELTAALAAAEAAALARAGKPAEALTVLAAQADDQPVVLDLQARVHAQLGDLAAADRAWKRVLELRPEDPAALAGCALIAEISEGRRRRKPVPVLALGGAAAAVLVVAAAVVLPIGLSGQAEVTPMATATSSPPVSSTPAPPTAATDPRLAGLAETLAAPGTQVHRAGRELRIVFADGLFQPGGNRFTAAGRRALAEWAQRLRGTAVRVTVLGHGVALPGGPASGGSTVALGRASAAAAVLAGPGLPLSAITVATAEQTEAPFHGPEAAARNRTVVVVVAPG